MFQYRCILISFLACITPAGLTAECMPTPHRTTGTHYEPVTVEKTNIGKGLMVSGRILSSADCKPIANARVAHWQAGENGRYTDKLRAFLYSDTDGRYQFETEWPNLNPPHIHFIITAEGFETLETQWRGNERLTHIKFDMVLEAK